MAFASYVVFQCYVISFSKTPKITVPVFVLRGMLLVMVFSFHMFSLSAQTPRKDSGADGLKLTSQVGKTIPKEAVQELNAVLRKIKSKGKKQLYILDFWTTWCGACLASLPRLNALQSKYSKDLQIILLNAKETKESAHARLKRIVQNNSQFKVPDLPQIYDAKLFESLFPHLSVPHHVWLDSDFKVIAITNGENTNEKNIDSYLHTQRISLPTKFELIDFEEDASLLSEGMGRQQNLLIAYSLLLDSIYGAPSLFKLTDEQTPSLRIVNRSLLDLIKIAYGMSNNQWASNPFRSAINIRLNGSALSDSDHSDIVALLSRKYCYENRTLDSNTSVYTVLQQDLKRFFDIDGKIQTMSAAGWVLEKGSRQQSVKREKGRVFKGLHQLQFYLNETYAPILGSFDYKSKGDVAIEVVLRPEILSEDELFNTLKQQGVICRPAQVNKQILQLTYKIK
ncbi:TlpA disulfide reductase family protein [Sphingobacterium thalpophilum]|uniref:TlpA disulfide reductase family protein n=2 Tax=Sphingobacterium thalpophilum TaxID=259 RepID=A0ABV4HB73_9SPHI